MVRYLWVYGSLPEDVLYQGQDGTRREVRVADLEQWTWAIIDSLCVVVIGSVSGSGSIQANGSTGGYGFVDNLWPTHGGGGSGGGSVTLLHGSGASTITVQANGGVGGAGGGAAGGAGTARKLQI